MQYPSPPKICSLKIFGSSDQWWKGKFKGCQLAGMGIFSTDQLHKTSIEFHVGRQCSYKGCFTPWLWLFHLQVPQRLSLQLILPYFYTPSYCMLLTLLWSLRYLKHRSQYKQFIFKYNCTPQQIFLGVKHFFSFWIMFC